VHISCPCPASARGHRGVHGSMEVQMSMHSGFLLRSLLSLDENSTNSTDPNSTAGGDTPSGAEELAEYIIGLVASGGFLLFVILCVIGSLLLLQCCLVKTGVAAVKKLDRRYIGVDIDVSNVRVNMCTMRIAVKNFIVFNPEEYKSEYLLKSEDLVIDISFRKLLKSLPSWLLGRGRLEVEVQEVIMTGVSAILELQGYVMGKSNMQWVLDFMGSHRPSALQAMDRLRGKNKHPEVDTVYAWRSSNGKHTYHTAPRKKGETIDESLFHFFAYTVQKPETAPVYAFKHHLYQERSLHFEPASFGETKGDVQFYAFRQQAEGTEPVYDSWDEDHKEHILHFDGPEFRAARTTIAFYAFRTDPTGKATRLSDFKRQQVLNENPIVRVYTWFTVKGKHTFHEAPVWVGESIDDRLYKFFAYGKQVPDTEPIWCFWNMLTEERTFHFERALEGEFRRSIEFYAFREQKPGTEPVFTFWNEASQDHTIHFDPAWRGEEKKEVAFYAFRKDPTGKTRPPPEAKAVSINVRKVRIHQIGAKVATKLAEAAVNIGDITYENFSEEKKAHCWSDIVWNFINGLAQFISVTDVAVGLARAGPTAVVQQVHSRDVSHTRIGASVIGAANRLSNMLPGKSSKSLTSGTTGTSSSSGT